MTDTRSNTEPDSVPLTVLGGYLGAGKTTLVNSLLSHANGRQLAVLVNDFGDVSIDAAVLRATDDGIVELAGGCVCCDLSLGMGPALAALLDRSPRPDQVIVEVSGVGEPAAVAAWGSTPGLHLDGIVVAVPLDRIRRLATDRWVGELVLAQLAQADLLACTRGDLLDPDELAAVQAWLRTRSDAAQVLAPNGAIAPEVIFGTGTGIAASARPEPDPSVHDRRTITLAGHQHDERRQGNGPAAETFVRSSTWLTDLPVDAEALVTRLAGVSGILRSKGFTRSKGFVRPAQASAEADGEAWDLVQGVGRHVTCSPWGGAGPPMPVGAAGSTGLLTILAAPDLPDAALERALDGWHRLLPTP